MEPQFSLGNVRANCAACGGAVTTFEYKSGGAEYGTINVPGQHQYRGQTCMNIVFKLLRCAGCSTGAIAKVHMIHQVPYEGGLMESFLPRTIEVVPVPADVPEGIKAEFREAELCASVQAWRAASALLRSTLEKTLRASGYKKGNLADRIDQAAADGVITAARLRRAHEDIRVLGNDVLHDEWRAVSSDEFETAHRYAQRILEDLYDDRASVEKVLLDKERIEPPSAQAEPKPEQ